MKGSYLINPPFEICTIKNMFNKTSNELNNAEKDKNELLFIITIPTLYLEKNQLPPKIMPFLKMTHTLLMNDFKYQVYDTLYDKMKYEILYNTTLLIFYNSHVLEYHKKITSTFGKIINKWIRNNYIFEKPNKKIEDK